jgi:succinate dehydrogenase / fumarate reductase, cytochrome b subunit
MSDANVRRASTARPLSPHLQIYRPTLTMMMSIAHRITGGALYVGTLLLAWWLIAAASNAQTFATISWFLGSWLGLLILFGFTWALFHHLLGGVRHALWDEIWGLDDPEREWLAQGTLAGGLVLTIIVWIIYFFVR